MVVIKLGLQLRKGKRVLRSDRISFPGDFAGYALGQFAQRAVIDKQRGLRLPQHVNEPWRDDQIPGINDSLRIRTIQLPYLYYAVASDRYVS